MSARLRIVLAATLLVTGAGCATHRGAGAGSLKIVCNVPQATLRIDDVLIGRVGEWSAPRPLGAGFHRVEIGDPDHFPFYAEIRLREGEGTELRAELHPQLE